MKSNLNASTRWIALSLLAFALTLPAESTAESGSHGARPKIGTVSVSGSASIGAPADMATLEIAVVTEATSSAEAVTQNGSRSNAALAALRKVLGDEAVIETQGFTLTPLYNYSKNSDNNAPQLRGYQARNVVSVKTSQLKKIGAAIDAAAAAGSNEITSLNFGIRDPKPLQIQALAAATADARLKAQTIAKALDTELKRVVSVDEGGAPVYAARARMESFSSDTSTPIESGEVKISAQVSLTAELAD